MDYYKTLDEICSFLKQNNIQFSTDRNNFCLNYGTDNEFEINYVDSLSHNLRYPRLGIDGINGDFFYKISREREENNSFAFWVKDFEWANPFKRDILKSYILHAAGKTPNRIYARDTEVKVFTNSEIKQFQIENCFYGYRPASLCLGLVLKKDVGSLPKGTLVMVTTFGRNFFSKKENYVEVYRVGTLKETVVVGGSSKLINHFVKNYPTILISGKELQYSKLIYYVDYDHGAGKSLEKMGFTFTGYSGGGFMNMDLTTGAVTHRAPMQHKQIMERIKKGEMIAIPNAGVKNYEMVMN